MEKGTIHRLEPHIYYYTFGPNEPTLIAESGDIVVANTRDAGGFDEKMEPILDEQKQRINGTLLVE